MENSNPFDREEDVYVPSSLNLLLAEIGTVVGTIWPPRAHKSAQIPLESFKHGLPPLGVIFDSLRHYSHAQKSVIYMGQDYADRTPERILSEICDLHGVLSA